jgi:hypothetical protein
MASDKSLGYFQIVPTGRIIGVRLGSGPSVFNRRAFIQKPASGTTSPSL